MANANADLIKLSFLAHLSAEEETRQSNYVAYRNYYAGEQKTQITARMRKFLELAADQDFCDNYCALVVDALNERLHITGFMAASEEKPKTPPGEKAPENPIDKIISDILAANRFDSLQTAEHLQALIDGDCYIIVDWDAVRMIPTITLQYAYTDSSVGGTADGVKMHYSDEEIDKPLYASKRWLITKGDGKGTVRRVNVYYPDHVEKWQSETGEIDWQQIEQVSWIGPRSGLPLGVPVFHFRNRVSPISNFGESEMRRALPLQDWLNKTVIDLIGAADTAAIPQFFGAGFGLDKNADGSSKPLDIHPGGILIVSDPTARAEWMKTGDIEPLKSLAEYISMEIARVTDTPTSRFQTTAQRASASTLQQEEKGLVSKAEHRQVVFGNAWEDAITFALTLMREFGGADLPDPIPTLSCQWENAATKDEAAMTVKGEKMLAGGMPLEYVAKSIWGLSEDEWQQVEEMKDREESRSGNIGAVLMRNFEKGLLGNGRAQAVPGQPGQPGQVALPPGQVATPANEQVAE